MTSPRDTFLVSTDWLAERLDAPDIVVVDGSWYLPAMNRDACTEYLAGHLPGAVFFDVDEMSDTDSDLPHMLPRPEKFASKMRDLGIGDGMRIVVYDGAGMFSAARVWWTFRTMGVRDVAVLDGGLPKWRAEGRPLEDGPVDRPRRHFTARLDNGAVRDLAAMRRIVESGEAQIVDARAADRFAGRAPEPRPGLRSGHIPGSINLPFDALVATDGTMKSNAELEASFATAGIDRDRPVVTSCGSGVTAAVLSFGLALTGHHRNALYDGSWAEWGAQDDTPVDTGDQDG